MKIFSKWRQRKPNDILKKPGISDDDQSPQLDIRDHELKGATSLPKSSSIPSNSFEASHDAESRRPDDVVTTSMAMQKNLSKFLSYTRKASISSDHDYEMSLLMCHYTLENAFLSIGTLGEELLNKLEADFMSDEPNFNDVVNEGYNNIESNVGMECVVKRCNGHGDSYDRINGELQKPAFSCHYEGGHKPLDVDDEKLSINGICSATIMSEDDDPYNGSCSKSDIDNDHISSNVLNRSSLRFSREEGPGSSRFCQERLGSSRRSTGLVLPRPEDDTMKSCTSGRYCAVDWSSSCPHHGADKIQGKCFVASDQGLEAAAGQDSTKSIYNEMDSTEVDVVGREKVDCTYMNHGTALSRSMCQNREVGFSHGTQNKMGSKGKVDLSTTNMVIDLPHREAKMCCMLTQRPNYNSAFCDPYNNGILMGSASLYRSNSSTTHEELHLRASDCDSLESSMSSSLSSSSSLSISSSSSTESLMGSFRSSTQELQYMMSTCTDSLSSSTSNLSACSSWNSSIPVNNIKERNRANGSAPKGCIHLKQKASTNVSNYNGYEEEEEEEKREEAIDYEMATLSCLKVISTNYQLELKRLILSVTPTYLAKHLLNRLKHIGRRRQADVYPTDYSYQRKFYKFLRTFRMKHKVCRASGVLKRELGPGDIHHAHQLALVHEHIDINDILEGAIDDGRINDDDSYGGMISHEELHTIKEEEEEEEMGDDADDDHRSTLMGSGFEHAQDIPCENWINTDDEYVVLELEGNKDAEQEENMSLHGKALNRDKVKRP
ncbi:hypothetical protein GOP47_0006310 [Adiantum capillus-veneris]|uniref:Uncharacterized protein n=1 Tax=Adiantum capillus-veneris TaxID=13818 RepID=A0A9D4ZKA2_ADICA|nr:hypothetical protein GOP47_0006310 [Adiantum capillus-veneris]